jgi:peptide/nickel transport system ATP-binding protein
VPADLPAPSLILDNVSKRYRRRGWKRGDVAAVIDVSFAVTPGTSVGLVGASGSGKTTLARLITGVEQPSAGTIWFGETQVNGLAGNHLREYRARVQMVFQDPYAALNPAHTVDYTLTRPLRNFLSMSSRDAGHRVLELLDTVGLLPVEQFARKLPHQLSGGQRQRVVIARALASKPKLIVADEPISMLDVSLRAGILTLLNDLRGSTGLSMLYITHDLLSARIVTDEVLIMSEGSIVERGATASVLRDPQHSYTRSLLDAIPNPFGADRNDSV